MRRLRTRDEGFTLIELTVAMVVIATVLLTLVGLQISAVRGLGLAQQRQAATGLLNRVIEEARALPSSFVQGGLYSGDLTGDPNIVSGKFVPAYNPSATPETLVTTGSAPSCGGAGNTCPPLYPHVQPASATKVSGIQYTVRLYVTFVGSDSSQGYWLTGIASWKSNSTRNQTKYETARSLVDAPDGCLSTNTTHPFAGPCQTFLDGSAGTSPAGITIVTADPSGAPPIQGMNMTTTTLTLPDLTSTVQSEQTLSALAKAVTSGGQYVDNSGNKTSWWGAAAPSNADTDPGTGTATTDSSAGPVTQGGSPPGGPSGGSASLAFQTGSGDSASSASTMAATSASKCYDLSGTAVTSGSGCSSSTVTASGATSATLTAGLPMTLASVTPSATPVRAFVSRYSASGGSYCPSTTVTTTGCVSANVSRALASATAGGVPTGATVPSGFTGNMLTVSNYSVAAKAESGTGTAAPAATRVGSLSYWNGSGYTTVANLGSLSAGASYNLGALSASYTNNGNAYTVQMTGSITVSPLTTNASGASPCQASACSMTSTAGSVAANITYTITQGSATIGWFVVKVDLGNALARTTYLAGLNG